MQSLSQNEIQFDDVDLIWQVCTASLATNNNELVLPEHMGSSLNDASIEELKRRLSERLGGTSTMSFFDVRDHTFRVCAVPKDSKMRESMAAYAPAPVKPCPNPFASQHETITTQISGKKTKIPRPPNAFILYRQKYHPILKEAQPTLHNNDISVILGKKWKSESEPVKARYKMMADKIKRQHAIDNPGYQYAPRKSSEKKRRMTARKLAQLNAGDVDYYPRHASNTDMMDVAEHDGSESELFENVSSSAAEQLQLEKQESAGHLVRDEDGWVSVTLPTGNPAISQELSEHNNFCNNMQPFSDSNRGNLVSETPEHVRNDQDFFNSLIDWEGIKEDMELVVASTSEDLDELAAVTMGLPYVVLSEEVRNSYFKAELERTLKLFE